jgi:hypothetical protein
LLITSIVEVDLIEELRNANPTITVAAAKNQAKDAAATTAPTTRAAPRSTPAQTLALSTLAPPNIAAAINHLVPAADPDHGAVVASSEGVAADLGQDPT